ncbi:unnamed protein product, partial [Adineta ricciae]
TVKAIIWRGFPEDIRKYFVKDQLVTWWSINSCSSSINVIEKFLGNNPKSTMFLIESLKGKQISNYTKYENEDEVILTMGTQFRVKSDPLKSNDLTVYILIREFTLNDYLYKHWYKFNTHQYQLMFNEYLYVKVPQSVWYLKAWNCKKIRDFSYVHLEEINIQE